jgi:hypothetical protein
MDTELSKKLIKGQRYKFQLKTPYSNEFYRANFFAIYDTTLVTNCNQKENNKNTFISTPIEWITNITLLEDILPNIKLPVDVLRMIDNFV